MNSSQVILKTEGLVKIYAKRRVVDGVSFHVNKGEVVGLLGPNGAGKTTSFRMTCGLIETNGGTVYLGGEEITNWPMYRRSREGGMGYLPQDKSVFQRLTVQNNLYAVMQLLGMKQADQKKRCDELLEKLNLTHLRKNLGSGLSGGERRRLEIARALVSNPKIMLLDEPFANIDPITVHSIQEIIRQLSADGIAILITDHQVRETLQITQRSYVIRAGQVLCHGTPAEVLSNPEARKAYFGEDVSIHPQSSMGTVTVSAPDSLGAASMSSVKPRHDDLGRSRLPKKPVSEQKPELKPAPKPQSKSEPRVIGRYPDVSRQVESVKPAFPTDAATSATTGSSTGSSSGKRLVQTASTPFPSRPVVRSTDDTASSAPEESAERKTDADPSRSGIMRSLSSMIWGTKK